MTAVRKLGYCGNEDGTVTIWMQMTFKNDGGANAFNAELIELCLKYTRADKTAETEE